jgi:plasmid stabilization system protein ParE
MRGIIISDNAKTKIKNLLEYIESKWSDSVRRKFAQKLYYCVKIIRENPDAFPKSENSKKIHKCVIKTNKIIL